MSYKVKFALWGALFGLAFPVLAVIIQLLTYDLDINLANIALLHREIPLLWIIDTAPLFLGLFASFAGRKQDKLIQINRELEKRVEERTRDLKKAMEEAEKAAMAKTQFLSTMSHEIRTPLNAVIGMSELLAGTELSEEQYELAHTINMSGSTLLSIINNILDFTKIESGGVELESIECSLYELIEDVLDLLSGKAYEKGLELAYDIDSSVPDFIYTDPTRLQQVLVNLVNNAIKFTEKGEVVIRIRCLGSKNTECNLEINVTDTGIGIPKEKIGKLFSSFTQVDASTTRKYGGTGLGLAISKKIVELFGGKVEVISEVGKGSTFRILLPARPGKRKLELYRPGLLKGMKAFVVDDNQTNRKIFEKQLSKAGVRVDLYENPTEVLTKIKDLSQYQFGILDMDMPQLNGMELAALIRDRFSKEELPLALLTSVSEVKASDARKNFNFFLSKPVRQTTLLRKLEEMLNSSSDQDRNKSRKAQTLEHNAIREIRILVAEDNPVNQRVAQKMLEKLGYEHELVENGREAVEAVKKGGYDVVLMDMEMPVMDGLEASRKIRELDGAASGIKIFAMTANAMEEDRERCLKAGMDDFISKPVTLNGLNNILYKWFVAEEEK